jgi:hypothetical protein
MHEDSNFAGFEAIAWKWIHPLLHLASQRDLNVVGLHGRTGGIHDSYSYPDRFVLGMLNLILANTFDVINYSPHVEYILFHAPEFKNESIAHYLKNGSPKPKLVFIENHLRTGAEGSALAVARDLRLDSVNAGVMFDLYHYYRRQDHPTDPYIRWERTLSTLSWLLHQTDDAGSPIPVGIHLPIGTNPHDSLPVASIDTNMWCDLGCLIKEHPELPYIVIENQQGGLGGALPLHLDSQRDRNRRIVDCLHDTGVI